MAAVMHNSEDAPHPITWLTTQPPLTLNDINHQHTNNLLRNILDFHIKRTQRESTPAVSPTPSFNQPAINSLPKATPPPQYKSLYLSASNKLMPSAVSVLPGSSSSASLSQPAHRNEVIFAHTWSKQATLLGSLNAVLWISSPRQNGFEVSVHIQKADCTGVFMEDISVPPSELDINPFPMDGGVPGQFNTSGPRGSFRTSYQTRDTSPRGSHTARKPVKMEIPLGTSAIRFKPGEQLILKIHGLTPGRQFIHYGECFGSRIVLPLVHL